VPFFDLLAPELEELGLRQRVAIRSSGLWVHGHQAAPLLGGLASVARAFWIHPAKLAGFLAPIALPLPVRSKSIERAVTYHKVQC
jgi:hypothetical protein